MNPLCCFADKDSNQKSSSPCCQKRCWSDYFSKEIVCDPELDSGNKADEAGTQDEVDSVDVSTDAEDNTE